MLGNTRIKRSIKLLGQQVLLGGRGRRYYTIPYPSQVAKTLHFASGVGLGGVGGGAVCLRHGRPMLYVRSRCSVGRRPGLKGEEIRPLGTIIPPQPPPTPRDEAGLGGSFDSFYPLHPRGIGADLAADLRLASPARP